MHYLFLLLVTAAMIIPVLTFTAVSAQEMAPQKSSPPISVDKYNELVKDKKNMKTNIITNKSVTVDPDKNTVTVGNQTLNTFGDAQVSADCIVAYHIVFHDDGTASCGVEDQCAGQSYSVAC